MRIKRIAIGILIFMILFSLTVFAKQSEYKVQLYFSPQIMNDQTGEISVDINLRNVNLAMPETIGGICSMEFMFEYDTEHFDVLLNDSDEVFTEVDDNMLIKSSAGIRVTEENGKIKVISEENTSEENLIRYDGTICRFTLVAKNKNAMWNSFDSYPIRFIENSIKVNTYNGKVNPYYSVEGIDGKVGAYNTVPSFEMPEIDKKVKFVSGSPSIEVNDELAVIDTVPFVDGGTWMIPVRYLAESLDMSVEWDGERLVASIYGEYKTLKVLLNDRTVYINSALCKTDTGIAEINGRIFIPVSIVSKLYPDAKIDVSNTVCLIHISQ